MVREETPWLKGTEVIHPVFGKCRVHFLYDNKVSLIIGDKKIGATGDCWVRIKDGKWIDWVSGKEVIVCDVPE
jgi:hypothetical protein